MVHLCQTVDFPPPNSSCWTASARQKSACAYGTVDDAQAQVIQVATAAVMEPCSARILSEKKNGWFGVHMGLATLIIFHDVLCIQFCDVLLFHDPFDAFFVVHVQLSLRSRSFIPQDHSELRRFQDSGWDLTPISRTWLAGAYPWGFPHGYSCPPQIHVDLGICFTGGTRIEGNVALNMYFTNTILELTIY